MARIRSIHPSLFTDEAFMSASPFARLLVIGLWCEAFDDGAIELKALTLKARIFPADAVNMAELLDELEDLNFFRRFEVGGKPWAAIRNFQKFQRPKKPNSSGVLPKNLVIYVGGAEQVGNRSGTGGGNPPQREEGRGSRREEPSSLRSDGRQGAVAEKPAEPEILPPEPPEDAEAKLFRTGKELLGKSAGGQIAKLLKAHNGDSSAAQVRIDRASKAQDPAEFIAGCIRSASTGPPGRPPSMFDATLEFMAEIRDKHH